MPQLFSGLTEADFDAYLPARATSNAYVRPRLEVKQKALAVGRVLGERAQAFGVQLDVQASDERPSVWNKKSVTEQWVFLWRDRTAREALERAGAQETALGAALQDPTPYYRHAFVALYLDAGRFEVTLRVHPDAWADVKNLRRRLETPEGRARLDEALAALPDDFALGVAQGDSASARACDATRVAALLDAAVATASWLYVARTTPRADAVARGADLLGSITEAFDALLPVYAVVAWRPDDDPAAVNADLAREQRQREAHAEELRVREAAWLAQQSAKIEARREQATTETRERVAAMEPARPAALHAATAGSRALAEPRPAPPPAPSVPSVPHAKPARARPATAPTPAPAPARTPASATPAAPREPSPSPSPSPSPPAAPPPRRATGEWIDTEVPVVTGARARIRSGPLAGKVGTVMDIDARGIARVALGLLSARVETRELVALAEKH